jgi:2,3-dimethylmalate lyase
MEQRIKAAADGRVDPDVMIVARTDAIASEGFELPSSGGALSRGRR